MNINQLIEIVKKKLKNDIKTDKIEMEDKSFLQELHFLNSPGKWSHSITQPFHCEIHFQLFSPNI